MIRGFLLLLLSANILVCPVRCGVCSAADQELLPTAGEVQACCTSCPSTPTPAEPETPAPTDAAPCGCEDCICQGALVTDGSANLSSLGESHLDRWSGGSSRSESDSRLGLSRRFGASAGSAKPAGVAARIAFQSWLL